MLDWYEDHLRHQSAGAWLLAVALVAMAAGWLLLRRRPRWLKGPLAPGVLLGFVVLGGLVQAWHLRWVADEAFLELGYARHLASGAGLSLTVGESSEGYQSLVLTSLLAVAEAVGIDGGSALIVLVLASFVGTIGLAGSLAHRVAPRGPATLVSLAAVLAAASSLVAVFAMSGLAHLPATLFSLWALERALRSRWGWAGGLTLLAVLTQGSHWVFALSLASALWFDERRRDSWWRFAMPVAVGLVAYAVFRAAYFGGPLVIGDAVPAVAHGRPTLLRALVGYGVLGVLPALVVGMVAVRGHLLGRYASVALPLFVGWMLVFGESRYPGAEIVALAPLVFVLVEVGVRYLAARVAGEVGVLVALPLVLVLLPFLPPERTSKGFVDWRPKDSVSSLFPLEGNPSEEQRARLLSDAFGDSARLALARPELVAARGRFSVRDIERHPRKHGVPSGLCASELLDWPADAASIQLFPNTYAPYTNLAVGRSQLHLGRYRPEVMNTLARSPEVRFLPVESALARYQPPRDEHRLACDLWFFEEFYFAHLDADVRARFIARAPRLTAEERRFYSLGSHGVPEGWLLAHSFPFEQFDDQWIRSGLAFEDWPTSRPRPGQCAYRGHSGALVNTYHPLRADRSQGTLQSPEFALVGDVMTLRIGGGHDVGRLSVSLLVGGQTVRRATGCQSESLRRQVWDIRAYRGQMARLILTDQSGGSWGHLLVDEVAQWTAP